MAAVAVAVAATADDGDGREWQNGNWCWLVPYTQSTRRSRNTGDTAADHRQKTATTQLHRRQLNLKKETRMILILIKTIVLVISMTKLKLKMTIMILTRMRTIQ